LYCRAKRTFLPYRMRVYRNVMAHSNQKGYPDLDVCKNTYIAVRFNHLIA
jgi:hypothetical protein